MPAQADLDQLAINTIRPLSIDAVQQAMAGASSEAAALAGRRKLANLCWIYGSNRVTIEEYADQPTMIIVEGHIGHGSPLKQNTSAPLGEEDDPPDGTRPVIVMTATGSEAAPCIGAHEKPAEAGIPGRIVNMPSWELFEQQPAAYRARVLPPDITARLSVEEASTFGWERYTGLRGARIGMTTLGSSAPLKDLLTRFGFTPDKVLAAAKDQIARAKETT
jgi:transketolase